ncbi:CatB-related O-acetyltransferase [Aeromonas dhakensis]|uniref:CatB-related O-acetyltransferase n=1 Tax=Aeromonas dhakensis TaxID=196024 RepID=UPI001C5A7A4F|nr:CatB-related O-acetyltransferase [Aeromonas dhakensis]
MIISENSFKIDVLVNNEFLDTLKQIHFYTVRTGLNRRDKEAYKNRFKLNDKISINKNAMIEQFSTIASGFNIYTIGSFSSVASSLPIKVKIGRYTEIGQNVTVLGFRHPIESVTTSSASFNFCRENIHPYYSLVEKRDMVNISIKPVDIPQPAEKEIIIENDVWIGSNVTLAGGIKIGNGSIIAANSIVTKSVEPYTIVGGNPAKFIKFRFPPAIIAELQRLEWWDYELCDIIKLGFDNPERFIENFDKNILNIRRTQLSGVNLFNILKSEL